MKTIKILFFIIFYSIFISCEEETQEPENSQSVCDVTNLNFQHILDFSVNGSIDNIGNDAVIDPVNKIMYFSSRGSNNPGQKLVRINLNNNSYTTHDGTVGHNWITTRNLFINNKLYIAATSHISTFDASGTYLGFNYYSIFPDVNQTRVGIGSWFDVTYNTDNQKLYFVGTDRQGLSEISFSESNKIRSYDISSNTFTDLGNLPKITKFNGIEYHNNNLYIFGGQERVVPQVGSTPVFNPLTEWYKYNLNSNTVTTLSFPTALERGRTTKNGNCIFITGKSLSNNNVLFYKLNTINDNLTTLTHNLPVTLTSTNDYLTLCSSNDKIYVVLYDSINFKCKLMVANLN
jgi:hypothetical protein